MRLSASEVGDCLVVKIDEDRLDAAVALSFKERLGELAKSTRERVVLDLRQVEFLDSSGLGAVVGAMKSLGAGRRMDLAGMTPTVERVFRMTRMDTVFRIYPDANAACLDATHAN